MTFFFAAVPGRALAKPRDAHVSLGSRPRKPSIGDCVWPGAANGSLVKSGWFSLRRSQQICFWVLQCPEMKASLCSHVNMFVAWAFEGHWSATRVMRRLERHDVMRAMSRLSSLGLFGGWLNTEPFFDFGLPFSGPDVQAA